MSSLRIGFLYQRPLCAKRGKACAVPLVFAHLRRSQPSQGAFNLSPYRRRQPGAGELPGKRRHRVHGRQLVVQTVAMVNVDFASPSLLLGTALIGCGVLLLNLRNFQNKVSRDADIVVAAMVSIVGSTLIFQGWRLDPLLLLCQALTTSVAFWYGLETFRLRSKEADMTPPQQLPPGISPESSMDAAQQAAAMQQFFQQQQQAQQQGGYMPPGTVPPPFLPPSSEAYYPWGAPAAGVADPASTSGRGAAAPGQMPYGMANPYAETIQYDYYGNPIMSPEAAYGSAGYGQPYAGPYDGPGDPYGQPEPGTSYNSQLGYGPGVAGVPASNGAGFNGRPGSPAAGTPPAGPMSYAPGFDPSYSAPNGGRSPPPSPPPPSRPGSPSALPPPLAPAAAAVAAAGPYSLPAAASPTHGPVGPSDVPFPAGAAMYGASQGGPADVGYGDPYGNVRETQLPPSSSWAGGASEGPLLPPLSAAAAGVSPGRPAGGGPAAGAVGGGAAQTGLRVDLFEKVDDWE